MNYLLASIKKAVGTLESPEPEHLQPRITVKKQNSGVREIIGDSGAIMRVKDLIERVAPSDARVLVTGENGTGKELVARWLHQKSERATGPFVEINCAAIPSELIESELFGHEKGAFTSAVKQRKGKFEQATGGTLFMDEIGDMSLSAQTKVLRALQENRISRVHLSRIWHSKKSIVRRESLRAQKDALDRQYPRTSKRHRTSCDSRRRANIGRGRPRLRQRVRVAGPFINSSCGILSRIFH